MIHCDNTMCRYCEGGICSFSDGGDLNLSLMAMYLTEGGLWCLNFSVEDADGDDLSEAVR